jgi:hypothetical protein
MENMENRLCLYRHIRLDKNEPFYIGIGNSIRPYIKNRNRIWKSIVKKTKYRVEILFDGLNLKEACEKEVEFIKLYGRIDLGNGILSNMTDGGDYFGCFGYKHTDESKIKLSISNKGRYRTKEFCEIIRVMKIGTKLSDETKLKISKSLKGRLKSDRFKKLVKESNRIRNSFYLDGILYTSKYDACNKLNISYYFLQKKLNENI